MLPGVRSLLVPEFLFVRPVSARDVGTCAIQIRIHSEDWLHPPARKRSHVRGEPRFLSTVTAFVASVVALIIVVNR